MYSDLGLGKMTLKDIDSYGSTQDITDIMKKCLVTSIMLYLKNNTSQNCSMFMYLREVYRAVGTKAICQAQEAQNKMQTLFLKTFKSNEDKTVKTANLTYAEWSIRLQ